MVIEVTGDTFKDAFIKAIKEGLPIKEEFVMPDEGQGFDVYYKPEGFSFKVSQALIGFDVVIGWEKEDVVENPTWELCDMLNDLYRKNKYRSLTNETF